MPFKSKAQRRKFAELLVNKKITPEAYERWNQETGRKELPERVGKKKKRSPTARRPAKTQRSPKAKRATRTKRSTKARRPTKKKR